jgi:hypothetical protein
VKNSHIFVMSPDGFFRGKKYRVFELPLLRNAQKRDKRKSILEEKKVSNYFFLGLRPMYVTSISVFFTPPLGEEVGIVPELRAASCPPLGCGCGLWAAGQNQGAANKKNR